MSPIHPFSHAFVPGVTRDIIFNEAGDELPLEVVGPLPAPRAHLHRNTAELPPGTYWWLSLRDDTILECLELIELKEADGTIVPGIVSIGVQSEKTHLELVKNCTVYAPVPDPMADLLKLLRPTGFEEMDTWDPDDLWESQQ